LRVSEIQIAVLAVGNALYGVPMTDAVVRNVIEDFPYRYEFPDILE
jgi:hypothetical protein